MGVTLLRRFRSETAPRKLQIPQSNPQSQISSGAVCPRLLRQTLSDGNPLSVKKRVSGLSRNLAHLNPLFAPLRRDRSYDDGGWRGSSPGVSARLSLPLSSENKGKGTARRTPNGPKYQTTQQTRASQPLRSRVLFGVVLASSAPPTPPSPLLSGSALSLPLRLNTLAASTQNPLPHALSQPPRLYS